MNLKLNDFSNRVVRVSMFRCNSLCRSGKMPFFKETYACVVGCGNERKLKPCRSLRYKKDGGKRFDRNAFDLLQLLQTTINVRLYNKTFYARYFFSLVNQTLRVSLRTAGAGKVRQLGKLPRFVKGGRNDRARRCVSLPTRGPVFG